MTDPERSQLHENPICLQYQFGLVVSLLFPSLCHRIGVISMLLNQSALSFIYGFLVGIFSMPNILPSQHSAIEHRTNTVEHFHLAKVVYASELFDMYCRDTKKV